ncbi:MAG: DUF134 domain-containing protein [Candidatus Helarchaeota archaeon]
MPRGYRWRKGGGGKGGRGRPRFSRVLSKIPKSKGFIPIEKDQVSTEKNVIYLDLDELEAMRLVDGENLTQDEAGSQMRISRGSIWRLLQSCRKKLITAIYENSEIRISFEALEHATNSDAKIL